MIVDSHDEAFGISTLISPAGEIRVAGLDMKPRSAIRIRIRARDVIVSTVRPQGLSALNVLSGLISGISTGGGPFADVLIDCGGQSIAARITRQSCEALGLRPGQPVFAIIKSVSFDRANTADFARETAVHADATKAERVG